MFLEGHSLGDEALLRGFIEDATVGIYMSKPTDACETRGDIGIVPHCDAELEKNVALAAALLFGLMYTINLDYPPEVIHLLKYFRRLSWSRKATLYPRKRLKNRLVSVNCFGWLDDSEINFSFCDWTFLVHVCSYFWRI